MRWPILANGEIYHVVNRGLEKRPTFDRQAEYERAVMAFSFYQHLRLPMRLSHFLNLPIEERKSQWQYIEQKNPRRVEILAYCLMPNHFHLLLRQKTDNAISRFLADVTNSYTRYFNTRHNGRKGPIFEGSFRSVRIESEEQLLHVSRYIHINPVVSYLVAYKNLAMYPWSSFSEYIDPGKRGMCQTKAVLGLFSSAEAYAQFCFDQIDYGKKLEQIKHLTLEE